MVVQGANEVTYQLCKPGCGSTYLDSLYMIPIEDLVDKSHGASVDALDKEQHIAWMHEAKTTQTLPDGSQKTLAPADCGRHQGVRVGFRRYALVLNKAEYMRDYEKNSPIIRQTRYLKQVSAPPRGREAWREGGVSRVSLGAWLPQSSDHGRRSLQR